jgi:transcriptional regulator with XRE-family HTH domain
MAVLPFCRIRLQAKKPINPAYPKALDTLGDHLRKCRLDLRLKQCDVAQTLGVDHATITNWELSHTFPGVQYLPKIYDFLGYCPLPYKAETLSQKIRLWRESLGLSQETLAQAVGVDESALNGWETGRAKPWPKSKERLTAFFTGRFSCPVCLS